MAQRPIVIGNFSAYLGDRYTALDEMMNSGNVDVLIGDYLAEITLANFVARYQADRTQGYVPYFIDQVRPHLRDIARRGIRIVVNAGALNPDSLAQALRAEIAAAGVSLRVAHIDGDDIVNRLPALQADGHAMEHLDTGAPLASWGHEPIAANAYLGGWGIAAALQAGADIVVCGRVTDASLVVGPCAWWHGWRQDDWNPLAGAVVAGHIIECGVQAAGANFTGFRDIPGLVEGGFPIAEVAANGTCVVTKDPNRGGAMTTDTVTAQLVYEIQGPTYLNPDVTTELSHVTLTQVGKDRVAVAGAVGSPPPATTKVAAFAPIGWQIVLYVFVTGLHVEEKIALLEAQVRHLTAGAAIDQLEFTQIGTSAADPRTQGEATVTLRIMATARDRDALAPARFSSKVYSLYTSSIPGFFHDTGAFRVTEPSPRTEYWPALLPMTELHHRAVLDDGRAIMIAPPSASTSPWQPTHPEPTSPPPIGPTRALPLGTIAYARSGDKGGNSNLGIWVGDDRAWPWLRRMLSSDMLRRLVPEWEGLDIVRHEFPRLRAVHFIVRGLLGNGGSSNLRFDQVGKAVGEYLLAKTVEIPVALIDGASD
ncbi:hypothetical protein GQ57_39055 [Burkholderia sp. MSh2]|uniref:ABC transporter substrate-binding protein n=1 Tax=Burkholderia paludis TaxID=1506587 RepID=A0A6J5F4G9_9BURK|nr:MULTISPECIES: acyclic terpene utilization AtuA family protein [Burkholderia]KEZ00755.1 hypothetical protein GQ57_39055 [Burkholderia sp. MSh2]CAB3773324.1 hypothetical protein LMG30113_07076 [Burkholderia paludis]VWC44941.1 ABC transporter substrate-binding protein [Burkholderia paludis]